MTINNYEYRPIFDDETINKYNNRKDVDEWGTTITINNIYGAEYNLCVEDGNNYSGIYFQECDEKNIWQTDFTDYKEYEINFNNPDWNKELEKEMKEYVIKILEDNNYI